MWGLPWGLLRGTSGRKELCMVPYNSCHIYGIWTSRSKKEWEILKSHQLGGWRTSEKGDSFHREGRFSLCNTALLWNFIASLTGYILIALYIYTSIYIQYIPLFTILLLFYVFEVGKAKSATQTILMILTLNGLFQKNV